MIGLVRSVAWSVGGALAAWALWLAELFWVKGWTGPAWAESFNWSALPICALIATSCSYFLAPSAPWPPRRLFIGTAFALNVTAFVVARWALTHIYGGRALIGPDPLDLTVLWLASLMLATGVATAADRWLAPLKIWTVALIWTALYLAVLLSTATVAVFPISGSDRYDGFKVGYQVFWLALLLPLSLRLARKGLKPNRPTVTAESRG
jgi:hypothetical protein